MSVEEGGSSLPKSSSDLCFDGSAFIQPHFSADRFLQEHRGKASLETMRDDLGSYLKVLRSATLDLIDHDYADFVGLSSSLVGLDKAVGKIRDPLGQLREEVMTVKSNLEETLRGIKLQLEVRGTLRMKRSRLESSLQSLRSLHLLESLLEVQMQDWHSMEEMTQKLTVAERSGAEYNHLQFCIERCDAVDQMKLCALSTHTQLMELLKSMLLTLIQDGEDKDGQSPLHSANQQHTLVRLLRAYAALNEMCIAEELVGEHIVAPVLDAIIKVPKDSGRSGSLAEMYCQILGVVDQKLGRLLNLTAGGARSLHVDGFDFLANSFWPQFVNKLEVNLPNMCAPGNPGVFHQRFTETMSFLERLEKFSGSEAAVKRLRSMPSYQHFLSSWSLPVYFQIRFQELAGSLESVFPAQPYPSHGFDGSNAGSLLGLSTTHPGQGGFWLVQTSTCWSCIEHCWDNNTFINQIGHKFWKMSLQFVARYCQWCRDILEHQSWAVKAEDKKPVVAMDSGEITDEPLIEQTGNGGGMVPGASGRTMSEPLLLPLCLHRDVSQLSVRLEHRLLPMAASALSAGTRDCDKHQAIADLLQRSLDDGLKAMSDLEPLASHCIVEIISQGSLPHLRQCRDIPRLYRRTNRAHPTRPQPYVSSTLSPALKFHSLVLASFSSPPSKEQQGSSHVCTPWVNSGLLTHWMQQIFSEITVQYHSGVLEVLTSVQKMEESLRRLKRIRGGGGATGADGEVPSSADDDEKIRTQLVLDVHHFCEQIESIGLQRSQIKKLSELVELVDNAISKVITRAQ